MCPPLRGEGRRTNHAFGSGPVAVVEVGAGQEAVEDGGGLGAFEHLDGAVDRHPALLEHAQVPVSYTHLTLPTKRIV